MTFSSDNSLSTNQLPISLDVNPEEEGFQSILVLYLRRIANAVNTKESGLYLLQENASFEQWFGSSPNQNRNGYRMTFDLIALNGGADIVAGETRLSLTSTTQPPQIDGFLYPVQGFGAAMDSAGVCYFFNDPDIYIRYSSFTDEVIIESTVLLPVTWAVWTMEYLKN